MIDVEPVTSVSNVYYDDNNGMSSAKPRNGEHNNIEIVKNTQNVYYDAYNSAVFIPDSGKVVVYHKTKLVPGAEKVPFPFLLNKVSFLSVIRTIPRDF